MDIGQLGSASCQAMLDIVPTGLFISDDGGGIAWVNPRFCELMAARPESFRGSTDGSGYWW